MSASPQADAARRRANLRTALWLGVAVAGFFAAVVLKQTLGAA